MKKLRLVSIVILSIIIVGFILWRFVVPFPDWLVRVNGIFMLVTIFTTAFSTAKTATSKKE